MSVLCTCCQAKVNEVLIFTHFISPKRKADLTWLEREETQKIIRIFFLLQNTLISYPNQFPIHLLECIKNKFFVYKNFSKEGNVCWSAAVYDDDDDICHAMPQAV